MMLRTHGEFIQQISATFEGRAAPLTQGILDDCTLQKLHRPVSKGPRYANTWRLVPELVDHYATQEAQV